MTTAVARLICDESTARRVASFLAEMLEPHDCACAAFEGDHDQLFFGVGLGGNFWL